MQPLIESFRELSHAVFQHETGSATFYVIAGISLFVWVVVARFLVGLFGSAKGFVLTTLALALPLAFGVLGYCLLDVYATPYVEAAWQSDALPWAGFAAFALPTALTMSPRLLDFGRLKTLGLLLLSGAAACGAFLFAQATIDMIDSSRKQVEKRDEKLKSNDNHTWD
ncbi:MAG: hypothetical protein ACLFUF_03755 [Opitutales bacterium]